MATLGHRTAVDKLFILIKVPMKWKIELLKNRLIWKAFKSAFKSDFDFHIVTPYDVIST